MNTETTTTTTEQSNTLSWWEKTHNEAATLAKWMALFEAVNIVAEKAEEKGITPENIQYKPKAISDYIKSTEDIILKKILQQDYKIEICYSEHKNTSDIKMEII
jgi:hypothetical protein